MKTLRNISVYIVLTVLLFGILSPYIESRFLEKDKDEESEMRANYVREESIDFEESKYVNKIELYITDIGFEKIKENSEDFNKKSTIEFNLLNNDPVDFIKGEDYFILNRNNLNLELEGENFENIEDLFYFANESQDYEINRDNENFEEDTEIDLENLEYAEFDVDFDMHIGELIPTREIETTNIDNLDFEFNQEEFNQDIEFGFGDATRDNTESEILIDKEFNQDSQLNYENQSINFDNNLEFGTFDIRIRAEIGTFRGLKVDLNENDFNYEYDKNSKTLDIENIIIDIDLDNEEVYILGN